MTEQNYKKIAEFLASVKPDNIESIYPMSGVAIPNQKKIETRYFDWMVIELIKELVDDNPSFNINKFRHIIYVENDFNKGYSPALNGL